MSTSFNFGEVPLPPEEHTLDEHLALMPITALTDAATSLEERERSPDGGMSQAHFESAFPAGGKLIQSTSEILAQRGVPLEVIGIFTKGMLAFGQAIVEHSESQNPSAILPEQPED